MRVATKPKAKPELNGHGGARAGAGRKPKALLYQNEIASAEAQIIAAMPDLLGGMIERAKDGDTAAAKYLIDKVLGKTPDASAAIANDTASPFTEADHEAQERAAAFRSLGNF